MIIEPVEEGSPFSEEYMQAVGVVRYVAAGEGK